MSTSFLVPRARRSHFATSTILVAALVWGSSAHATATLGFRENWTGTSLSTWSGGSTYSNPGTGGYGGAGDGMLVVGNAVPANLGTRSNGPEYAGNWTAAGITQVRVWLRDVGNPNPLEIHFGIGRDIFQPSPNVWQYNVGLIPPSGSWGEYVVDLTSANWTQVQGSGTLLDAVSGVQTIHLRHDVPPFMGNPDPIQADFAVDRLLLTNGVVGVGATPPSVSRPVQLAAPSPNPSRRAIVFSLRTFDAKPIRVQIVDASGRLVRSAELPGGPAGARSWSWDGADDRGRAAAPGNYRVRALSESGGTSRPFVRVR